MVDDPLMVAVVDVKSEPRNCREGKDSKAEMVWTRNEKERKRAGERYY